MATPGKFDEGKHPRGQPTNPGQFAPKVGEEAEGGTSLLVAATHYEPPRQVSATMTLTGPELPERGLEIEIDDIGDVGHCEVVRHGDGYEAIWSERYDEYGGYDWEDTAEFKSLHSQRDADEMSERFQSGELDRNDPRTFMVERYEHGAVVYGLPGESSQVDRGFDVTPVAGYIKVPDDVPEDRAEDYARGLLEDFNGWSNGDTHVAHAQRFDRDGNRDGLRESSYGLIGAANAEDYVKSEAGASRTLETTSD